MLTIDAHGIPEELRQERAWCVWRSEERGGKPTKVPYGANGGSFKSNDPTTWRSFEESIAAFESGGYSGIGRAVSDPYVGFDVDLKHVEGIAEGESPAWLGRMLELLDSWTEWSPSGKGVHVWLRGTWHGGARQNRLPDGAVVEVYDSTSPRYFTVTGNTMLTSPTTIRSGVQAQAAIDKLAEELAKATAKPGAKKGASRAAEDELPTAAEGQRRAVLTSEAGRLRVLGASEAEARAVLRAVAGNCTPPVPDEHVEEILAWAWTKSPGEPRLCPVCDSVEPCQEHSIAPPRGQPGRATTKREAPKIVWFKDALLDASRELDAFHMGDLSEYVSTGITTLDQKLGGGFRRRQVVLIGAPTGGGKTTLLMSLTMAALAKGPALFVSPEMAAVELVLREIIRQSGTMKWKRRPWKPYPEEERNTAAGSHARAVGDLGAANIPIAFLDRPAVTMGEIEDAAHALAKERGRPSVVVIDYAQEVADSDPRTPRYLTVGAVASRSIALAEELHTAVIVASQVNVVKDGNEESYVARESAILKHKAHFVLEFAVDWEKPSSGGYRRVKGAKLRCTKARNGPTFELALNYRPELYRIEDIPDVEQHIPAVAGWWDK